VANLTRRDAAPHVAADLRAALALRPWPAPTPAQAEREALERAVDRMGWPEINAFHAELDRGQDIAEDAGGYLMRAVRALFGLPSPKATVTTYQAAARAMVRRAA